MGFENLPTRTAENTGTAFGNIRIVSYIYLSGRAIRGDRTGLD